MPKALETWESYEQALAAIKKVRQANPKLTARLQLLSVPTWIQKEKHRVYQCPTQECRGKLHVVGTFQPRSTGIALACDMCGRLYRSQ
ncbi:hypothetical protein HYR99_01250 [Candidatus Poribacteria bacterium]|nr:hypothetical protein [Candidatus Poribacteria bacterium]